MFLRQENLEAASEFIAGPVWADLKRCLLDRRPGAPSPEDLPHVAAAKGFQRAAWEAAIAALEKLPYETDSAAADPFDRPAVSETRD